MFDSVIRYIKRKILEIKIKKVTIKLDRTCTVALCAYCGYCPQCTSGTWVCRLQSKLIDLHKNLFEIENYNEQCELTHDDDKKTAYQILINVTNLCQSKEYVYFHSYEMDRLNEDVMNIVFPRFRGRSVQFIKLKYIGSSNENRHCILQLNVKFMVDGAIQNSISTIMF